LARSVSVYDIEGKQVGEVQVPSIFSSPIRVDLIKRAVVALQSHQYQPQGRDPMAGKRTTAESIGVGHAMSRIPRVKGDRYARANLAAFAPGTVKGRLAFPPTTGRRSWKKINRKEIRLALISALAATSSKELVTARGHKLPAERDLPLVVSDEIEKVAKTSEAEKILKNLGIWQDIQRASKRKIRGGRGSLRGRALKHPISALLVVDRRQGVEKAFRNFTGVKVVDVASLNVSDLAPGTHPGRLTVWSQSALDGIATRLGERSE